MGKHRHRSRSPDDYREGRSHQSRKYKRERSHSRSPEKRHRRDDVRSSKWEDSPEHRHRGRRDEPSGSRNYDRDRESNRERKMEHHRRRRRNDNDDDGNYEWGKRDHDKSDKDGGDPAEKEKPNFGLSGKLAEDTNKVNGVVIKYAEPPEARIPKKRWRLYPFKGEQSLPTLHIHRQSCYLIGRDRKICDIPVDHPSCSKQHAALQYRLMPYERNDGTEGKRVVPYIIDLESANGTFLNNKPIDAKKYHQLMEKDVLKFGFSTREYVILHENAKDDETDDFAEGVEVKTERD